MNQSAICLTRHSALFPSRRWSVFFFCFLFPDGQTFVFIISVLTTERITRAMLFLLNRWLYIMCYGDNLTHRPFACQMLPTWWAPLPTSDWPRPRSVRAFGVIPHKCNATDSELYNRGSGERASGEDANVHPPPPLSLSASPTLRPTVSSRLMSTLIVSGARVQASSVPRRCCRSPLLPPTSPCDSWSTSVTPSPSGRTLVAAGLDPDLGFDSCFSFPCIFSLHGPILSDLRGRRWTLRSAFPYLKRFL